VHVAINAINTPTYFLFPRMAVAMGLATFGHKVVRASRTLARARWPRWPRSSPRLVPLASRVARTSRMHCTRHVHPTFPMACEAHALLLLLAAGCWPTLFWLTSSAPRMASASAVADWQRAVWLTGCVLTTRHVVHVGLHHGGRRRQRCCCCCCEQWRYCCCGRTAGGNAILLGSSPGCALCCYLLIKRVSQIKSTMVPPVVVRLAIYLCIELTTN
jgi:hypothetical protein